MMRLLFATGLLLSTFLASSPALADIPPTCSQFPQPDCADACEGKRCVDGKSTCYKIDCYDNPASSAPTTLYKCSTCLAVIEDTGKVCTGGGSWGKPCGDGGTCSRIPGYCPGAAYAACTKGNIEDTPDPGGMTCDKPVGGAGGAAGSTGSGGSAGAPQAGAPQAGAPQAGSSQAGSGGSAGAPQAGAPQAGSAGSAAGASSDDSSCAVAVAGARQQGLLAGLMLALGAAALLFDRRRR